jgi:wyosine [tRNA(Phe)-imidazoG37] synthetase (radical SAM superfamily)
VITNGSLLWDEEVRRRLLGADVVMPSLDAGDEKTFQAINRPHGDISFEQFVRGLISFRKEYHGEYWLEVLLLAGLTDTAEEVRKIADIAKRIQPDRVQLNTCVRPPAHESAAMVDPQRLLELSGLFSPRAEVIADFREGPAKRASIVDDEEILRMLSRRPCTAKDIAAGLGMDPDELVKRLDRLVRRGRVEPSGKGDRTYYLTSKR